MIKFSVLSSKEYNEIINHYYICDYKSYLQI